VESVQWYLRRLRVMSLREIAHRSSEPARLAWLRLEGRRAAGRRASGDWRRYAFCTAKAAQLPAPPCEFAPNEVEVSSLLAGDFGALGFHWRWQPEGSVWHRAPDTGRLWPAAFFGSIAYRSGNPYGDVRVLWEPARLQGLTSLALLSRHEPACRERATQLAERILQSFVRENPYLEGPHYISAMECALRIIAVCHAFDTLRTERLSEASWDAVAALVTWQAALIAGRLSLHSSSGNHLIAECAGLIYAGMLFAEHPRAAFWFDTGLAVLAKEADRQVLGDGGGIEQAFAYQLFVVDLLGLVQELLRSRGRTVPAAIVAAVASGRVFLRTFADNPGELPAIGDSDGGFALSRYLRLSFSGEAAARKASLEWLTFHESGYSLGRGGPQGLRVVVDHGPLGMAPGFAHAHADALSVTVDRGVQPLLIDPGTFAYGLSPSWRRYFRGTRAHNTVTVDGLDQAVQQGAFLWSAPYECRLWCAEGASLLARHSGYVRSGVTHWRGVLRLGEEGILVWDRLEGSGEHELELNWHLGVDPEAAGGGVAQLPGGYRLSVRGGDCSLHRGQSEPPFGWASSVYGQKHPVSVLRCVYRGALPHEFVTLLGPNCMDINITPQLAELRGLKACPRKDE
jgi:hypothetical protein